MSDKKRLASTFLWVMVSLPNCGNFDGSHPSSFLSNSSAASNSQAMMRVASTLVESAEYSQTISILQIFDSHGSDNVDAPVIMGKSFSRLGAYLEAIKVCDQVYDKQSKIPSPSAWALLGWA